jgi:hypothetical protein
MVLLLEKKISEAGEESNCGLKLSLLSVMVAAAGRDFPIREKFR